MAVGTFGVLYLMAGYYAFSTPVTTAVVLTSLLSIALIIAGVIRTINHFTKTNCRVGLDLIFRIINPRYRYFNFSF